MPIIDGLSTSNIVEKLQYELTNYWLNGFIGKNLVNYFVNEGHTVAEYDYIEMYPIVVLDNVIQGCY